MTEPTFAQTGADLLVQSLLSQGVDTCFANPGTSEMHMVAALDRHPGVRSILALFEGVATGAADGYARMSGKPAATLLHLGPGLANGIANLHNARKAATPVLNIVGDHATHHLEYDAPLTSDLDGLARTVSHWLGRALSADEVAARTAEAVAATRGGPGRIATLVMPADAAWSAPSPGAVAAPAPRVAAEQPVDEDRIRAAAALLRRHGAAGMLMLGGATLNAEGIRLAAAIARSLQCRMAGQSSNSRMQRGPGIPRVARVPYPIDQALAFMQGVRALVRIGAPTPVAFFAYPGKPSMLVEDGCEVLDPVPEGTHPLAALKALAAFLDVDESDAPDQPRQRPERPQGALAHQTVAEAIASTLPDHAIVVDEAVTTGRLQTYEACVAVGPHDWINNMGGSIGYGLPVALGASIACPERRVLALVGDGSAFYTSQALWTMAREGCDVTVVIYANRSYAILQGEWKNMGAGEAGRSARDLLRLDRPDPDWVAIARGHGVPALRVDDAEGLCTALERSYATSGPMLIEAWLD
ncbi:acetolactate synthase large subunit [Xylophilus rhododendri]|uniref:Acetolactate synthase large subunit n=1 Tax=Xylophilus rhododendri TaxID=2697032 RepID=A0A857JCK1_9BURK|nr:acetolactate synthase large subunit [Xylophilus rhododendri]QHJ00934.1 acetolactate synthase large subunit [Xylophilus rhododendri]